MKVLLIGKTKVDLFPFQGDSRHVMPGKAEGSKFEKRVRASDADYLSEESEGQELIEFAGRLCYESFHLPNEDTSTNDAYVRNIVSQGHESVLEHVSVTFYVEGVSRNLTHELIRHRHLSFSELSQRFVNMEEAKQVIPPAYQAEFGSGIRPLPERYVSKYKNNIEWGKKNGLPRKQNREAARAVLPGSIETKLVVTGNLRAWRDVLKKRLSVHADAEMQEFALKVWEQLSADYPDVFADIEYQED